ncbi:MAG: cob(I)yrinic acid a,c-diamide adenosyltransferase [Defluviitaleaceae bacterium]|nr:cob(I)yrinic acid a,c-diamide adenosyltransferase [Defluviitaleaceae bacterium]
MKLYTKTGDKGTTSLYGGSRVPKDNLKVWAYGTVDELNVSLGLVYANLKEEDERRELIKNLQKNCFMIGAELASDEKGLKILKERASEKHIEELERLIDSFQEKLPKFTEFTYPGYNVLSANIHLARVTCRRAERYAVSLEGYENVKKYLNRLSDLLYIMAEIER